MRSFSLVAVGVLSLGALALACATSPTDDIGGAAADSTMTAPTPDEGGAKLPPSTMPTVDSGTSSSGSSGATGGDCDVSSTVKIILYEYELTQQSSPVACPCSASQCCYLGVTCLAK